MNRNGASAIAILILLLGLSPAFGPCCVSAFASESRHVVVRDGTGAPGLAVPLNSFVALGDGHVGDVLRGLKVISLTEEAKSGEWEKMRGLLAEFGGSGIKAAALWYLRPDGSYYTVENGLMDQNLRDRSYFKGLMSGEDVIGDLVISRSTGRRTAIVAVPIKKDGKTIGAIGASLSVGEISRALDREMGLPQNMFFYALDKNGRTSLHRTSTLIFAYPSDMGSKSLAETVRYMLARPEGEVTYDFYGERTVVFKRSPLTGWVFAVGIVTGSPAEPRADLPPVLSHLQNAVEAELDKLDMDLAGIAAEISETDFDAAGTREMLRDLCRSYSYAVDCALVDKDGRMTIVEPAEYRKFEGSDISGQEQMIRLRKTGKPVMSSVFKSVEGFEAADLEYPIFYGGGFAGSVSVLLKPEALFAYVIEPLLKGLPVEAFAMQTDGRILYDQDKEEVGKMLFDDPMYKPYPQLVAVGTMVCKERTGAGSYDFRKGGTDRVVKKDAHWATVGLHGTEWRLVVMHVRPEQSAGGGKEIPLSTGSLGEALRKLADNADLKKACAGGNSAAVSEVLQKFYADHPGIYSVQWLDADGINRGGYPEENSLINFDMKTEKTDSAAAMLKALSGKKAISFDSPLVEGKTGAFLLVPVQDGGEYLGVVYTITLKE